MPIQPLSVQGDYEAIPDVDVEEDVSPVDGSISKRAQKTVKYIVGVTMFVAVVAGLILVAFLYNPVSNPSLRLYQTSMAAAGLGMKELFMHDVKDSSTKFALKHLNFGNTDCKLTGHDKNYHCEGMTGSIGRITVESSSQFQEILGFGGAFTEATALNFYSLPQRVRAKVLQLYFGMEGIGLTLGRVHINSCDFGIKSYNFDAVDGDYDLTYFDTEVTHDNAYMLPLIREAMSVSKLPIKLMASPWSPPPWMKQPQTNKTTGSTYTAMDGSAYPNGLKDDPKVKLAWARYIAKFIHAYVQKGVPIWSVTPQNEPEFPAPWEACAYTAEYEKDFVESYLGPVMETEHPNVLILGFDHNKDHLFNWTRTLLNEGTHAKNQYIDGMAFHWYSGVGRVEDGTYGYDTVNASHHYAPYAVLIGSEGCSCPGVELGNWLRAERLGHDILFDLRNYAQGWIDWNLLVNNEGGPNHLGNNCDAALVTNKDFTNVHVQPKYHYFGHFSKFVVPGSTRIASTAVGNFDFAPMDPNVQAGLELGMFHCEKSVRQTWWFNSSSSALQLATPALTMDVSFSGKVNLCVARGQMKERQMLRVVDCTDTRADKLKVQPNKAGQLYDSASGQCISLVGDVREPGALLELSPCLLTAHPSSSSGSGSGSGSGSSVAHQHFKMDLITGEITTPNVDNGLCLTAGWPFLNAVAFTQPSRAEESKAFGRRIREHGETVVVIMNEAARGTQLVIEDASKKEKHFGFTIAARAIETVIYK